MNVRVAACTSIAILLAAGCGTGTGGRAVAGGDPAAGKAEIARYGCGGCHRIGGIDRADARVGPSLRHFGSVRFIAGTLPNTPANAIRWIVDPQGLQPGTIMPDLGVSRDEAADIVAYLERQ